MAIRKTLQHALAVRKGAAQSHIYVYIYIYVFVNGDHFVSILGEIQLTFVVLGYQLRLGFVGILNVLGY